MQRERLKAAYIAKAGIKRAMVELEQDASKDIDHLNESWANYPDVFKEFTLGDGEFTVSYNFTLDDKEETFFGVMDEERKININRVNRYILSSLPQVTPELADNIRAFRGDTDVPESSKDYGDLGYACKSMPFVNVEELMLVKGMTPDIYNDIKELITVWGQAVNINTASRKVIEILVDATVAELMTRNEPERDPGNLVDEIMRYRQEGRIFTDTNLENYLSGLSSGQKNIINALKDDLTVNSLFFRITSSGKIPATKLKYQIECVLDANTKMMLYWNEG